MKLLKRVPGEVGRFVHEGGRWIVGRDIGEYPGHTVVYLPAAAVGASPNRGADAEIGSLAEVPAMLDHQWPPQAGRRGRIGRMRGVGAAAIEVLAAGVGECY